MNEIVDGLFILLFLDCQLNSPLDKNVCVGDDVKIDWVYGDAANFATVDWKFIDSTSTESTIMQIGAGESSATIIGGFNVEHVGDNGGITLKGVTKEGNSGSYKIVVTYSSATQTAEDTVAVTVNDNCEEGGGGGGDNSLKDWEIALIVIGVLVGIAISVGVGIFVCKRL